jgi:hypothetical protein
MKKLILFTAILIIAFSCKKIEREPLGPTDVRVRNITTSIMTNLTVNTFDSTFNYGTVKPDSVTAYHRFNRAYQKANITAIINGNKFKTDTAIYFYMVYLGKVKATCEIWIENEALRKLSMRWIYEEDLK